MQEACARYYFWHYLEIFGKESIADVYANIPHILIWDDHDIIDGWGSYEPSLQACPVFQGLFQVAKRFYLLFQHHTTEALAATQSGLFGEHAWNFVKYIAPDVAILGADMRANRTIQQIITPANYDAIFSKLNTLHGGVRHVVLVSAVPMAYTELPLSETGLKVGGLICVCVLCAYIQQTTCTINHSAHHQPQSHTTYTVIEWHEQGKCNQHHVGEDWVESKTDEI